MSAAKQTGADRAARLLAVLRELAAQDEPCPADQALAEQLDCREDQVGDAFALLLAAGLIDWHRVVVLCERREQRGVERAA